MAHVVAKAKRQRTFQDKAISGLNAMRYALTEPYLVAWARWRNEHAYKDGADHPLISVYVPTYNRGELLMECAVASVFAQTYSNWGW